MPNDYIEPKTHKVLMDAYYILSRVASHPAKKNDLAINILDWMDDEKKWMDTMTAIEEMCPEAKAQSLQPVEPS